jgi:beta-fructofuranosidase
MNRRELLSMTGLALLGAGSDAETASAQETEESNGNATAGGFSHFPNDPHRPRYHFLPPRNWMNDPNGLIYYKNQYHLFYQHNPGAAKWGDMHWGHAVSPDLLRWAHLPIALKPTPGGYDKDGVFSGCMVVDGDVPTIVYTGTQPEVQAIATSTHRQLETWTKWEGNPVISGPPEGLEVTGFRDPFVWREGEDWLMALGSGVKGKGGIVLLYRSPDLRTWEYLHPLAESDDPALGTMWECPNFFPLGGKHVLILSPIPLKKAIYAVGTYENRRFTIERVGSLDDGGHFYAPQVFLDSANRRVMFGWSWEGRSQEAQLASGWAGALTLPRVLSLDSDNSLRTDPHPYCRRLHRFSRAVKSRPIGPELDAEIASAQVGGDAGRLDVTITPGDAKQIVLAFYCSSDGKEQTRLIWNQRPGELVVDRAMSSLDASQDKKEYRTPLTLAKNAPLQLTIYFDRSLVEIYALGTTGTTCLTTRVYPCRKDSTGIRVSATGKNLKKTLVREMVWRPISLRLS